MKSGQTGNEIAIIGMAGQFPGAENIDQFWKNLAGGIESIRSVTVEDLMSCGIDPAVLNMPDYVPACAPLDNIEGFDASFFGYRPRDAEIMDPQHRLLLECAWAALENAGYAPDRIDLPVGVYVGVACNTYMLNNLAPHPDHLKAAVSYPYLFGNEKDYAATQISFRLNLKGPALSIQAACSSSGIGIHYGCQGLLIGEIDMALAGGCRVISPQRSGYLYVEGSTMSPDGHVRTFDADAAGMVRGSGGGIIVLKRLEDALSDGDHVYAVIKGSAINNDGADKQNFTSPSVSGQRRVISDALDIAEVEPESISYIEAHGTGTSLGDPIELTALTNAFRRSSEKRQFCRIGSAPASPVLPTMRPNTSSCRKNTTTPSATPQPSTMTCVISLFNRAPTQSGTPSPVERFDYRVLAPLEITDINDNRAEVIFDVLGLPAAMAVKGKQEAGRLARR